MFTIKKWMKPVSRAMVLNMFWMSGMAAAAGAAPVQTAFRVDPDSFSKSDRLVARLNEAVLEEVREHSAEAAGFEITAQGVAPDYPWGEAREFPEKNTMIAQAANFGGFIITFSSVLVGYLALYVPLGSYGAAKCVFDDKGWNDCWNTYMNRTFH